MLQYSVVLLLVVFMEFGAGVSWSMGRTTMVVEFAKAMNKAIPGYDYVETVINKDKEIVPVPGQTYNNHTVVPTMFINMVHIWVMLYYHHIHSHAVQIYIISTRIHSYLFYNGDESCGICVR